MSQGMTNAWVMLLTASGFSASVGHAAETPAQWLAEIEEQAAADKAAWNAEWRDVMRGAALALEPYDGRPEVIAKVPPGASPRLRQ